MRNILATLFFLAILPNLVSAQGLTDAPNREALDRQAAGLYQQVFSPFCPGRSLNDCPSSKAQELKIEMRQKLEEGVSPDAVLEQVFERFGEQYRAVPRYDGFGRLVWWAPIGFVALGGLLALIIARGRKAGLSSKLASNQQVKDDKSPSSKALSAEVKSEIERELAALD